MIRLPEFGVLLIAVTVLISPSKGVERAYYVAIEETIWDYAPSEKDLIKNVALKDSRNSAIYTVSGRDRIGTTYKKAVYRQYEDSTFTTATERPEHMGISGPALRAEVDDVMIIHVKNFAHFAFSMHPHGVFYEKSHEGAMYKDGTNATLKVDDAIPHGESHIYRWEVTPDFGPAEGDPDCITWAYHSHVVSMQDTNSGLVGPLLVCRPGSLDENGNRLGVDKEFFFLLTLVDENLSWYLNENILTFCSDPGSVDKEDEGFQESNKMHAINGFVYGNLPGLSACKGDTISLHLFGVGTEADVHSVHFQGHTVVMQGHRVDIINIFPGVFATAIMEAYYPGNWEVTCSVNHHLTAGMSATFAVDSCDADEAQLLQQEESQERNYYIGIIETDWNYAPTGQNMETGMNLTEEDTDSKTFFEQSHDRIGGVYKKAVFRAYDAEFATQQPDNPTFGILGPLIAAEVGDTVRVSVKNFAQKVYNIEPSGVFCNDFTKLQPGDEHTYIWSVPESVAPTDLDEDCITYMYTSTVNPVKDTNSGLVGPILICRPGTLAAKLERSAYYLLFTVFNENLSHYRRENIDRFTSDPASVDVQDGDFMESNLMHSINGLMYTNLQGIEMCEYAETDFHLLGLGTEIDIHSVFFGGITYKSRGESTNVINVFPHTTAMTTLKPTRMADGELVCSVLDHLVSGMNTKFTVNDCGLEPDMPQLSGGGTPRTYYIGAVEEVWDYFPWDEEPEKDVEAFVTNEKGRLIGHKYLKAMFFEYTDDTFTTKKKKDRHLGILGPVISAEEGDRIEIVFKNMARGRFNIVPWGILDEALYPTGPQPAEHGETVTYYWDVPASAAPSPPQPGCTSYAYVSAVDVVKDLYSGLFGPLLICRKGELSPAGFMKNVDAEFFLSFFIIDESNSHYVDDNIRRFAEADPESFDKENPDFVEGNLMHGINGHLQHVGGLEMYDEDRVIWHLLGFGNEVDLHTVHFHAHAYIHTSDKVEHGDVFQLFPGKVGTVEMNVNNIGEWLLHCHVNDHMAGGMTTTYKVLPKEAS